MGVLVVETEAADPWIPPPPKKKWIRHYLSGEIPKDYSTFSSSAASELSPLASSPPSPPSAPPPALHHHHLPPAAATNGLCSSYSPPSSSASSSPPPVPYSRPPSTPPPPTHPTPPADPLRDESPPFLSSHRPTPLPLLLPSSAPILHNHLNQGQLYHHRPLSPRSAPPSPTSTIPTPSHDSPFHDFQTDASSYALKSESELGGGGEGESGGGGASGGISSSSPSRSFRRITVSSQLARLEEAQELRRRVGSGTREVHNKLEKNRRAHLKECFELLKKQLPASQEEKKSSNLSILHSALRYIQTLKRKERDYEHEMERLAREKIASQQRLSALKKELSAQWDHIDFNTLLPQESATGGGGSPRRLPCDDEEDDCVKGADGVGGSSFEDSIRSRKDLRLPITSDHNSNSTSTASERGHLSDDGDDMLSSSSRGAGSSVARGQQQLARHSFPLGGGKRSPRPIMHGGSAPASPTPPALPPPQRSSVLQQHRLALPSSTPPSSPAHTPPPKPAPGSPRPPRHFSPTRQMVPPDMMHHHPEEEGGIAVTAIPAAHVPAQVVRTSHSLATALVSPSAAAIHLLTSPSQRHHDAGVHHTGSHRGLHQLHVPPSLSHSSPNSPKTASPNSSPSSPASPLLLAGHPSQQPLALTVHGHPTVNSHFHHSSQVSSTTATAAISVPTIHLAGKVVQHPVAFLGTPTSSTPASQDMSHELEGAITSSSSSGKFGAHHHHHLHQQPTIAIAGGSIALPNGVVAHASSASAGVTLARAVSPGNSARGSLPTPLTLAHSPNSGGTTTMLTTAIHGAGTTPISALPAHLAPAGVTHLLTPLAGGHAALVTTSGGGGGHSLMAPLALVSSTGGPVAAHILGAASASSSGSVGGAVGAKVMASSTAGAIPLLKPVAMGGQLPLMNAQYLTTAALGGIAHLVKPLVVVSSAPSAPNHGSGSKIPSSLTSRSESSTPQ